MPFMNCEILKFLSNDEKKKITKTCRVPMKGDPYGAKKGQRSLTIFSAKNST